MSQVPLTTFQSQHGNKAMSNHMHNTLNRRRFTSQSSKKKIMRTYYIFSLFLHQFPPPMKALINKSSMQIISRNQNILSSVYLAHHDTVHYQVLVKWVNTKPKKVSFMKINVWLLFIKPVLEKPMQINS